MPCDVETILQEANCILAYIPPGAMQAVKVSLMCQLAGGGTNMLFVLKAGDTMTGALVLPSSQTALQIGGITASFPALGNNGALLQARLADNSNYANFQAGFVQANQVDASGVTQPVALELYHETTGGAGGGGINGGVSQDFRADSDTTDRQQQFRVSSLWQIAAHATRTSELRFFPTTAGVGTTDCLRLSNAQIDARNNAVFAFNGIQVVGARNTGWTTFTGTANKNAGGLDTGTCTTAQLAQVVKSVVDALIAHGLLGA
jgi:hypothetical protein